MAKAKKVQQVYVLVLNPVAHAGANAVLFDNPLRLAELPMFV